MKTWKMSKYADESGRLVDPTDAQFIARKLEPEDVLDFAGVADVSTEFLDGLLAGAAPTTLGARVVGAAGATATAIGSWAGRLGTAPSPPRTGEPSPVEHARPPVAGSRAPARPEVAGERYTPTRLVNRLRRQLSRYIESAYPLSDPTLVRARRRLLEEAAAGTLLGQDPYV